MKIIVDIKDKKADFVMELLGYFPFVKSEIIAPKKSLTKNQKDFSDSKEKTIKEIKASFYKKKTKNSSKF